MSTPRGLFADVEVTVTISGDTTLTTATLYGADGTVVLSESATARRMHGDKQNDTVGINYATARVLERIAKKLTVSADGLVKHADDMKAQKAKQAKIKADAAARSERSRKAAETRRRKAEEAAAKVTKPAVETTATAKSVLDEAIEPVEHLREM